jgi:small-conductance mechanosensitive channel
MTRALAADDLGALIDGLLRPAALAEAAVLVGCLLAAWGLTRLLRGPRPKRDSVWFGKGVIDGLLFPVLALALAFAARAGFAAIGAPLAMFQLALPVLLSLALIRLIARVLQLAFPGSALMRLVERSVSWVVWVAVALWITGLLPLVMAELDAVNWRLGGTTISLRNVIEGLVTAAVVLIVALWVSAAIEARLLKGSGQTLSLRKMAASTLRALLLFVGLMIALGAAGIDLTALSVLGGALGVGIGFGLQKLAANYVSGFVILAERSIRIGDMVALDGFEGRVTDISSRYTLVRSLAGRESIVPNEMLITQRVENLTLSDAKVVLKTGVQVAYGTDLDALLPKLAAAVQAVPRVLADPPPAVQLDRFADNGIELAIPFWIGDAENGQANVRSEVNLAILRTLNAEGVEIPFPQQVVHGAAELRSPA